MIGFKKEVVAISDIDVKDVWNGYMPIKQKHVIVMMNKIAKYLIVGLFTNILIMLIHENASLIYINVGVGIAILLDIFIGIGPKKRNPDKQDTLE